MDADNSGFFGRVQSTKERTVDWQDLFQHHILMRGKAYSLDGAVNNLTFDEGILRAWVEGSDDYEVEIKIDDGIVKEMFCDCPYADSGEYCKHMAAVLFTWEAYGTSQSSMAAQSLTWETDQKSYEQRYDLADDVDVRDGDSQEAAAPFSRTGFLPSGKQIFPSQSLEQLMDEAGEDLIRNFMVGILDNDPELKLRFASIASEKKGNLELIKRSMDRTLRPYTRAGYIKTRSMDDLNRSVNSYLDTEIFILFNQSAVEDALDLIIYLTENVLSLEVEESLEEYDPPEVMLKESFEALLLSGDPQVRKTVFQWICNMLFGPPGELMRFAESLWEDFFDEEDELEEKRRISDALVRHYKPLGSWYSDNLKNHWAKVHLDLSEGQGASSEYMMSYARKNWDCSFVRCFIVDYWIRQEEPGMAVGLLKEILAAAEANRSSLYSIRMKLKDLYQTMGDAEQYQEQLRVLVTQSRPGDPALFQELKAAMATAEWISAREEILGALTGKAELAPLLQIEGLWDRLLTVVLESEDLEMVKRYEKELIPRYPEEILKIYETELQKLADMARNRSRYDELIRYLKRVGQFPGGDGLVKKLIHVWQRTYSTRRLMVRELENLRRTL